MELNSKSIISLRPTKYCVPEKCEADSPKKRYRFRRGNQVFTPEEMLSELEGALASGPEAVLTVMHDYSMIKAGVKAMIRELRVVVANESN